MYICRLRGQEWEYNRHLRDPEWGYKISSSHPISGWQQSRKDSIASQLAEIHSMVDNALSAPAQAPVECPPTEADDAWWDDAPPQAEVAADPEAGVSAEVAAPEAEVAAPEAEVAAPEADVAAPEADFAAPDDGDDDPMWKDQQERPGEEWMQQPEEEEEEVEWQDWGAPEKIAKVCVFHPTALS